MEIADLNVIARTVMEFHRPDIDNHPCCFYLLETIMTWSKPEFLDQRFGFEITMYIANR